MNQPLSNKNFLIAIGVLGLVLLSVSVGKMFAGRPSLDETRYQAVFLENGQEYFGHLKNIGTAYPYLTDIYYIQSAPLPENPNQRKNTLVKLGNELHGPEDVMYLNWDKVVFWENMKPNAEVLKGITQEKAQRQNPASPSVSGAAPTAGEAASEKVK